jgi:predicted nucleic acid-binding protein
MLDSTSPLLEGYVLDTNVLSKLAKANQLNLLHQLTTVPLYITPHIQQELEVGLKHGVSYLLKALQLVDTGELELISPTSAERGGIKKWPAKLGLGEIEAIALCRKRNLVFISHDSRAIKYGEWLGVGCLPLTDLLEEFANAGLLTTSDVASILA